MIQINCVFQDIWVCSQEISEWHGKRVPPVCWARPGAAGQRHRQLCLEGHDRLAQKVKGQGGHKHPFNMKTNKNGRLVAEWTLLALQDVATRWRQALSYTDEPQETIFSLFLELLVKSIITTKFIHKSYRIKAHFHHR